MFRCIAVTAVCFVLSCSFISAAETPPIVWHTNLNKAAAISKTTQRHILLFLTAPGCTYCKQMKQTFSQPQVIEQIEKRYVAVQIDGRANPHFVKRLRVRVYPTTALLTSNGRVIEIMHGFKKPAVVVQRLSAAQTKATAKLAAKMVNPQRK